MCGMRLSEVAMLSEQRPARADARWPSRLTAPNECSAAMLTRAANVLGRWRMRVVELLGDWEGDEAMMEWNERNQGKERRLVLGSLLVCARATRQRARRHSKLDICQASKIAPQRDKHHGDDQGGRVQS